MINRSNSRIQLPSHVPHFSDADIIRGLLVSSFWKNLFLHKRAALWTFVKTMILFKTELLASPFKLIFRHSHGRRTMGVVVLLMSVLGMIGFNAQSVLGLMTSVFPLLGPAIPFVMEGQEMRSFTLSEIRSDALMVFWMMYLVLAAIYLRKIYIRKSGLVRSTHRGSSWIYSLVLRKFRCSERFVQFILEPVLIIGSGYLIWSFEVDKTFGLFLMIGGASLFFQELQEAVGHFIFKP